MLKKIFIAVSITGVSLVASDILATVDGKRITKQEVQDFLNASAPGTKFDQLNPAQQKMILDRLIERALFLGIAKQEKIDQSAEFKRSLEKIKEELTVNLWMKKQLDNAVVSDSEAKEFYDKNKERFMQKAKVHARHILVKTEEEAKKIIDELKDLKGDALKQKFIELAKKKSTGPSGKNGGDLGTFQKGAMVPPFSKAVWSLKPGEITKEPVKTQFGYHVIYLESKTEAKPTPYEKVKEQIVASLKQQQFAKKIAEVAKELRKKAKIVYQNDHNATALGK